MTVSQLPPELWQQVFRNACLDQDNECSWVHFWLKARQVSRSWRAHVAETYLDLFVRHPKRTIIHFDCGWHYVQDRRCQFAVEMTYDRLDKNNKARAVFKEGNDPNGTADFLQSGDEEYKSEYAKTKYEVIWRNNIEEYLDGAFDRTPYVISVKGLSLDSELPGLQFDTKSREISFEWETMLNAFCQEYAELHKRDTEKMSRLAAIGRDAVSSARTEEAKATAMMNAVKALFGSKSSNLKDVRRHRIKKFYKANYGDDADIDDIGRAYEKEQLRRIEHAYGVGKDEDEDDEDGDMVDDDFADEFESKADESEEWGTDSGSDEDVDA
ncbi:hypothetical protein Slin15195_G074710 [Septoria linicola]|uniref:Uncharacterized protein n=1 Tax=Septoria linicola TaxID=215465 RepID=A0A9Q9EL98_9PEZI|nr:hypothetical protein Slin14017_G035840 [Septoria linicola]USW54152.1 hypothetical protein Slin15195_G074710 [Septoria linicola]